MPRERLDKGERRRALRLCLGGETERKGKIARVERERASVASFRLFSGIQASVHNRQNNTGKTIANTIQDN